MPLIHDPAGIKLGRKPAIKDTRTLRLARYLSPKSLPAVPDSVDWGHGISGWDMFLNDQYGCCTAAGAGHLVKLWNDRCGREAIVTNADILALYEIVTRNEGAQFDPTTGKNDNGCVELDVLRTLRDWQFAGRKVDAFVAVDVRRHELLKAAIYMFGGAYVGLKLPISAQNQGVWRVTNRLLKGDAEPGSWGGHCVAVIGYDASGLTCVTWGQEKRMTWDWWDAYGEEAWALLSEDWIGANQLAPNTFNFSQLKADLAEVGKSPA
ncbi:hypothetical protein [uncultured Devosia sp.]|uniref:hypothetical protein n=1 Tax=uncultured Devosia sp. TaxID=211434 RepID=UPI002615313E|nr:hypothetical protein [uncultured Devosia sp.]